MVAEDRGFTAIVDDSRRVRPRQADPDRAADENGEIDYGRDPERQRFQQLVNANALGAVEALLEKRPELATDPFAFWSEGVLMMPAHGNHWPMIELLMRYGARVPDMTKWCREYYFKHYDTAAFLMERGMNPNHMNCDRTTLLHGMAQLGDVRKAALLLDRGAAIDAVDDEFRSTPLGLAARWGHVEMVRLLLDRGADRTLAGADWATPRAWARRKGHKAIEDAFRLTGRPAAPCSQHDSDGSCGSRRRRVMAHPLRRSAPQQSPTAAFSPRRGGRSPRRWRRSP